MMNLSSRLISGIIRASALTTIATASVMVLTPAAHANPIHSRAAEIPDTTRKMNILGASCGDFIGAAILGEQKKSHCNETRSATLVDINVLG